MPWAAKFYRAGHKVNYLCVRVQKHERLFIHPEKITWRTKLHKKYNTDDARVPFNLIYTLNQPYISTILFLCYLNFFIPYYYRKISITIE